MRTLKVTVEQVDGIIDYYTIYVDSDGKAAETDPPKKLTWEGDIADSNVKIGVYAGGLGGGKIKITIDPPGDKDKEVYAEIKSGKTRTAHVRTV